MKTLEIWNPFRELDEVQNRLRPSLEGFPSSEGFQNARSAMATSALSEWSPQVDISEDEKEYLVKADLPEMKKEDVKVTIEDNVLSISGERKSKKEEKKRNSIGSNDPMALFFARSRSLKMLTRKRSQPIQGWRTQGASAKKPGEQAENGRS